MWAYVIDFAVWLQNWVNPVIWQQFELCCELANAILLPFETAKQ